MGVHGHYRVAVCSAFNVVSTVTLHCTYVGRCLHGLMHLGMADCMHYLLMGFSGIFCSEIILFESILE